MPEARRLVRAAQRDGRLLGLIGWAAVIVGFGLERIVAQGRPEVGQNVLVWTLTIFFAAQVIRLCFVLAVRRDQRPARAFLLVSVLLWASGSALLNAGGTPDLTHFPSRGELLFLGSYVAMAVYLVLSSDRTERIPADIWLQVVVICGGTTCLSGSLLLTPIGRAYAGDGLSLLLALLYPLIDLVLAALVVGQAVLRMRTNLRDAAGLTGGFLLFALADSQFVTSLSSGTYHFSVVSDAAWGVGFALLVGAACRSSSGTERSVPRTQGPAETLAAAAVAAIILTIVPATGFGLYLTIPAVITLLGAGGRLVMALREARGAAEALALSRTDDLTRLPNRRALRADLEAALQADRPLSLMLLDLDGFKDINDTLGHSAGDDVLRLMAHRLRRSLPREVTIARLGGDEFAVIVYDRDEITVIEMAQSVLEQLRAPVLIDGIEITSRASIGVATRPSDGVTGSELLRRADVAMYQAKQQRIGVAQYDVVDDDFSKAKLALAEELRRALDEHQLELWYQPQIAANGRQLCGLEALIRWRHPRHGIVGPVDFLPAARQAGLMPAISSRVAELALRDISNLRPFWPDVRVAINCAPPELLTGWFLPDLYRRLADSQVSPAQLVIEVTEDSFMSDPELARDILQDIRDHGMHVALDDYGTGFSSLAYLRDLAIDELKIDRTFIMSMLTDDRTRMIVSSTIQMAAALGVRTVAEGVEDAATELDLVALGVDVLQGYHLGRPMPLRDLKAWMLDWETNGNPSATVFDGLSPAGAASEHASRSRRSLRALAPHRALAHKADL